MHSNFGILDGIIIAAYLIALSMVGVYFSRRQKGIEDFFLARRSMAWFPVGLSLMAALNSGLDYLQGPANTINYGAILLFGTISWIFLYLWVAKVTLPFFRRLNLYTAYEYLEQRFDVRVRSLAAGIFILWRLGWMATALYVPCLAINAATGGQVPLVPMILILGTVVTLYTMLGGIKAVIWTDVIQFCIMFGGLAATMVIVLLNVPGGMGEIWHAAAKTGKLSFSTPIPGMTEAGLWQKICLFFKQDITLVSILVAGVVGRMTSYTGDQVMVQRFQTTKSVNDSKRAFIINALGDVLWCFGLAFVGFALFAYIQQHPLPDKFNMDKIVPYFMARVFPTGMIGLVIAAILAASLSSIDSAINSCTSVLVVDFYNRLVLRRKSGEDLSPEQEARQVFVSRIATALFGIAGMALACCVSGIGPLIEIANRVIQLFTGPLLAIYILGMFVPRSRSNAAFTAGLVGALVSAYISFNTYIIAAFPFLPKTAIGFMWPTVFGFTAAMAVGLLISFLTQPAPKQQASLTFKQVMKQPEVDTQE